LEEIQRAVFGTLGSEPDVYADYDRLCELSRKMREAIRALSSPDHADAGNVEGDGWLQKAGELYDRCKLFPETSAEGFTALLQLRNHVADILPAAPGASS
ncbi:hypothetical protein D6J61_25740, partial [Salmonella enterica subsp. enterica serovar Alachua]|nr:hypothetical protein [Salmonella enterica subsp. enterica serovar Alachua]